ncbi:MAG TPA: TIR domain-containing protein [Haloferula sp.]
MSLPNDDFVTRPPEFDVFLSYATEDLTSATQFAERLKERGVKLWFDRWELKPGDHLLSRLNDGLCKSRKLVALWSKNYFADQKVWTHAESFAVLDPDILARDRPLVPVLIGECQVPPLFRTLLHIDFRTAADFEFRLQELVQALDIPVRDEARKFSQDFAEPRINPAERGKSSWNDSKRFEDEVARIYEVQGFDVKRDIEIGGILIDLMIEQDVGGLPVQAIVECKDTHVIATHRDQIIARKVILTQHFPAYRWISVSSSGFAPDTRAALESIGVTCVEYRNLLRKLVKLEPVVESIIHDYQDHVKDRWQGDEERFIRPLLKLEGRDELVPAIDHLSHWMAKDGASFLLLLGDLGTGKTTLSRFLAYQLARSFLADPLRHPAPILIPLKKFRKEISLEGIITGHFAAHGVTGLDFSRFTHLLRQGKVLVFFDAFDEMADRVNWEITLENFRTLQLAVNQWHGKALVTCRTHYFKNRNEEAKVIGKGPSLTQVEADLMREIRGRREAEVAYLREFSEEQIQSYLRRARPGTWQADWQALCKAHELDDLAKRPLLLELIVRFIDKLKGRHVTTNNLYNVCVEHWIKREDEDKRRTLLDGETRRKLMIELAWQLWADDRDSLPYQEMLTSISGIAKSASLNIRDEAHRTQIAHEMHSAAFLKREGDGFVWMHRSFGEYFLARKIHEELSEGNVAILATKRLDRKTIGFLAALDEERQHDKLLCTILTATYHPKVSENALQILYWSARIACGMEESIPDREQLADTISSRLPEGIQLSGAELNEIILEGARLHRVNLEGAVMVGANLNGAVLTEANLRAVVMPGAKLEDACLEDFILDEANLASVVWTNSTLRSGSLDGAIFDAVAMASQCLRIEIGPHPQLSELLCGSWEPIVQLGAESGIAAVTWSKSNELLAVASYDGLIRLYRANDGRLLRTLESHIGSVWSVVFDPTGHTLASSGNDETVKLWDVDSGTLLYTLESHVGAVWSVAFDPSGSTLASGGNDKTVKLWDTGTGTLLRTLENHRGSIQSVAFDPAGRTLACGGYDNTVKLWDAGSGTLLNILKGHHGPVQSVAFNPAGSTLASGGDDRTVKLWDARTGELLNTLQGHKGWVLSVAFDPTGNTLASGSDDRTAKLWHAGSGALRRTFESHSAPVRSVAFDPAGKTLASGSGDKTVKLWDAGNGKLLRTFEGRGGWVQGVAFDPTGGMFASGGYDKTVTLWNVRSGKLLRTLESHEDWVQGVAFDPAGGNLASSGYDKTVKLWDPRNGKLLRTLEGHRNWIQCLAFNSDGSTLASGCYDSTVKLWDPNSGMLLHTLEGNGGPVQSVAFNPAGSTLASGGDDGTVNLWDADSGKLLCSLEDHGGGVLSIAFNPVGGILASGSDDKTVKLWDPGSNKLLRTLEGHSGSIQSVAFDPTGRVLASGGNDKTVKLWDPDSGKLLRSLDCRIGPTSTLCFSSNGRYLVAAGAAGRLQFWDYQQGNTFLYICAFAPNASLALLPDGRFDGTPEALHWLCYTERGTLNSLTAFELVKEFHSPQAVQETLAHYRLPIPAASVVAGEEG